MPSWIAFPFDAAACTYEPSALTAHWTRLHRGDAEPLPTDGATLEAWSLFHAGQFERATRAGLQAGGAGVHVANKAQAIYANYLETREKTRLALFAEVAERAQDAIHADPRNASGHYALAYALARTSQGVNVARAQALGLGARIREALEAAIALAPAHADAHTALGLLRAEIIDRLGRQPGKAEGADAATGLRLLQQGLALDPDSAIARIEYADGLVMLEGDRRMKEAEQLYAEAAAATPRDATERLDVERAKAELAGD